MIGLYFIFFDNGLKLGRSGDIPQRLRFYSTPWSRDIERIFISEVAWIGKERTRQKLLDLERFFKDEFADDVYKPDGRNTFTNYTSTEFIQGIDANEVKAVCASKGLTLVELSANKLDEWYR